MEDIKDSSKYFKFCEFCGIGFKNSRDEENHNNTKKHINNVNGIDKTKCEFCNYTTKINSDLKKHVKTVHKEIKVKKVEKSDICTTYPIYLLNTLINLKASEKVKCLKYSAKRSIVRRMINKNYKEDEPKMIEAKANEAIAKLEYESIVKRIESILVKYPQLEQDIQKALDEQKLIKQKEDDLETEQILESIKQDKNDELTENEIKKNRLKRIEYLRKEISINFDLYLESHGNTEYTDKIKELELELNTL